MLLPLLLLILAAALSAALAYGTHPFWAQFAFGLSLITTVHQFEWLLVGLCMACCVALGLLAATGRSRIWWLAGLGPVAALLAQRWRGENYSAFAVLENPSFVGVAEAAFMEDDDYVLGLVFNGTAYAYPAWLVYPAPVVVHTDQDRRMVLLWSAPANCATAWQVSREMRGSDLKVVSMPANSLLVYNSAVGEFISGVTGRLLDGRKPTGFIRPIEVHKLRWRDWRRLFMNMPGRVLAQAPGAKAKVPNAPLAPSLPLPRRPDTMPATTIVAVAAATRPVAIPADRITSRPMNVSAGDTAIVVFRDPQTGQVRCFDRRLDDLIPRFAANTDRRRRNVFMIDSDSLSGWTADGVAVDGPMARQSRRLTRLAVEEGLYWGVMRTWMKDIVLGEPIEERRPEAGRRPR